MAATASITLVKTFTYRGQPEEWSNTYHLDNQPAVYEDWLALTRALCPWEAAMFTPRTTIVRAIGHNANNSVAVFEHALTEADGVPLVGTITTAGINQHCPGDTAWWIRWSTTQLNSRGKPIYLRSYYHDALHAAAQTGAPDPFVDELDPTQVSASDAYAGVWTSGVSTTTGKTYKRAGPRGAVAQSKLVGQWLTTRTLEKRGARRKKLPAGATIQLPPITIIK